MCRAAACGRSARRWSIRRSAAREIVMAQQHPQIGRIETLAPVVRLSRTPAAVTLPPPALGEHTAGDPAGLGKGCSADWRIGADAYAGRR